MESELKDIIERCKGNDHKAFEIVYKKYYRVLLGIALRYTGRVTEAEDVLQDSFIKIFRSINSYDYKGSFEGWIKRIVQNTAINSYKSNLKFNLYIDLSEREEKLSDDSMDSNLGSMETKEILVILNALPEGYRLVINLYFIDGYSHKEIAEMLKVSVGTSKSQLFKAKNYLRNLIEINSQKEIV